MVSFFAVSYGALQEQDDQFIYLALELCHASFADVVEEDDSDQAAAAAAAAPALPAPPSLSLPPAPVLPTAPSNLPPLPPAPVIISKLADQPGAVVGALSDLRGRPSATLTRLLHQLLLGIAHLHALHIVHRDIKPQNILLTRKGTVKISDMGLARKLDGDRASFSTLSPGTFRSLYFYLVAFVCSLILVFCAACSGVGTLGWVAPEALQQQRLTRAVDVFAAGCVIFYMITDGRHPFGSKFERERNVLNGKTDLAAVQHVPEAADLIKRMIDCDPKQRISIRDAVTHPFFWTAEKRLNFLQDVSDRLESEEPDSALVRYFPPVDHLFPICGL